MHQVDRGTLLYVMEALDASGRRIKLAVEAARVEKGADPIELVRTAFKVHPVTLTDAVKGGRMELVRGKL